MPTIIDGTTGVDQIQNGTVTIPKISATGTASSSTFLRGDGAWAAATPTVASTAEAQAGTNNTNFITPLRMREGFNASGSAPVYACRAWVNFDGTTTTPTIRASGNVFGVTRRATGQYTINFAAAISDVNYATVFGARNNADGQGDFICEDGAQSSQGGKATTSLDVMHANISGYADTTSYYVAIFR
jgi:hypothetical protein